MKPTGQAAAIRAIQSLKEGISYQEKDCQDWVEYIINSCIDQLPASEREAHINYRGSNDMARNACFVLLTRQEAAQRGLIMPGAMIFIHDPATQPKGYNDGKGDFDHVGIYVGENALTDTDKNGKARTCNAMHSSYSMGRVAGTVLYNEDVSGSYTHVGLFECLDYGIDQTTLAVRLGDGHSGDVLQVPAMDGEEAQSLLVTVGELATPTPSYLRVMTANGLPLKIREAPDKGAITKYSVNNGAVLLTTGSKGNYYKVVLNNKVRYGDKRFLFPSDITGNLL